MHGYRNQPPSSWRSTPLPRDWPTRRARVLRRDLGECRIQGPRCRTTATEVDHIGDPSEHGLDNLQAVCRPCHATKTGQENARRLNANRPKRRREPEPHPGLVDPGG